MGGDKTQPIAERAPSTGGGSDQQLQPRLEWAPAPEAAG